MTVTEMPCISYYFTSSTLPQLTSSRSPNTLSSSSHFSAIYCSLLEQDMTPKSNCFFQFLLLFHEVAVIKLNMLIEFLYFFLDLSFVCLICWPIYKLEEVPGQLFSYLTSLSFLTYLPLLIRALTSIHLLWSRLLYFFPSSVFFSHIKIFVIPDRR